jgi:RHS repeat-associated protein
LAHKGIPISASGYLYIYVSNATPTDVFFDNLSVVHYSGPLIEENHYYPFGLGMAGISDKAIKPKYAENRYRYNAGSELQHAEFSDGTGLELYETSFRSLDPQLGRFAQIDPLADEDQGISCYAYVGNNPVLYNDPAGLKKLPVIQWLQVPNYDGAAGLGGGGGDGGGGSGGMWDNGVSAEDAAWAKTQADAQQSVQDYMSSSSSGAPIVSLQDILASTPKEGAAILTADGTGAFNLVYANEASASFGTKNGQQGTWISYGYGDNNGSGSTLASDEFVHSFIAGGDQGDGPGPRGAVGGPVPYYGNFVGPGHDGPKANPYKLIGYDGKILKPIDMVDAAAQRHDYAYWMLKASGINSALRDDRTGPADRALAASASKICSMFDDDINDSITNKPISQEEYAMAQKIVISLAF